MQRTFKAANICVRNFSSAPSHQPPKIIYSLHGRYAGAVYTAASKIGMLEKVEGEFKSFQDVLIKSPNFAAFLANPTVPRGEKVAKVGDILEEGKISHITRNLFVTMAANGRIGQANKVIAAYEELMQESRGTVKVVVTSAEPLKKKTLESIQAAVLAVVGSNKTVDLQVEVNESILGGLQLMIGDKFLDLSVAQRIGTLSKTLEGSN